MNQVHRNIPFSEYRKLEGLHKSDMFTLIAGTPEHYKYRVDHPEEFETKAKDIGRDVHCIVLEPSVFEQSYAITPEPPVIADRPEQKTWNRTLKEHKAAWQAFMAVNQGKNVLDSDQYDTICGMRDAVMANDISAKLIQNANDRELSLQWDDAESFVQLKGRLDAYHSSGIVVDLKCCRDASPTRFGYDAYKYGYGFQAAMYLDGCAANGLEATNFVIVAVENAAPYCVAVYDIGRDWIDIGREQYRHITKQIKRCQETGNWPGYDESIMDLPLPGFAGKELLARID